MTAEEYKLFLARHGLRQADGGWLCGKTLRQSHNWTRDGVPVACSLLLTAYDEGLLPLSWFFDHITEPVP